MFRAIRLAKRKPVVEYNFHYLLKCTGTSRNLCDKPEKPERPPEFEHPVKRTVRILGDDLKRAKHSVKEFFSHLKEAQDTVKRQVDSQKVTRKSVYRDNIFPEHCDVLVIGGGAIGSSIAYWLKQRAPKAITVTVVEKDPLVNEESITGGGQYSEASTVLSVGGLRQQFSLEENIRMSLFGAEFLRSAKHRLAIEGEEPPDVHFTPFGYLYLATEEGAQQLEENYQLQQKLGAKSELLTPRRLKENFPWINTEGIALGCHGLENEGWFDPWALLMALKKKSISLGVDYVNGEVLDFTFQHMPDLMMEGIEPGSYEALDKVLVKCEDGELRYIKFAIAIIAAGPHSGKVARMARIGTGKGMLSIPLPVEPRKRYVYCFECKNGPGLNSPLTIDPTGTYFRREGLVGCFIAGRSPKPEEEPSTENLEVDYEFFERNIWPVLAQRVPAFESIKVKSAWSGFYEFNTYDENGFVGPHPYYHNLYLATGFSGHGIQHSPAIGRAVMEMILDGGFDTIDLKRMSFDRLITDMPIKERNIW